MKRKNAFISLKGKKKIDRLFKKGENCFIYPFKVFYLSNKYASQHRLVISIPKRYIKKAVNRNLIRRRIKEAFYSSLKNKTEKKQNLNIGLVFVANEVMSFSKIKEPLHIILLRISN